MGNGSEVRVFTSGSCPGCSREVVVEISDPIREALLRGRKQMQGYLLNKLVNATHPEVHLVLQFIEGTLHSEVDDYVESHKRFVEV